MVNFTTLQNAIKKYDSLREDLIKQSRVVLKLSKQLIYSIHRDEMKEAANLLKSIEKERSVMDTIAKKSDKLVFE